MDRGKTVYPTPVERGYKNMLNVNLGNNSEIITQLEMDLHIVVNIYILSSYLAET